MSFWSKLFGGSGNGFFGQPYRDKAGKWRIRIYRVRGGAFDNLFNSSIEDTYPSKAAAVAILKSVKQMGIE